MTTVVSENARLTVPLTDDFCSVLARRQTGLGSKAYHSSSFELHPIEYRETSAD